jgi:DNA-binding NarL/FixJ family response regulator
MLNRATVLIADDNLFFRESLREVLSGSEEFILGGEATNGEEAISLTKEISPDIILMDINMPVVNGLEATPRILRENPHVKIIALSLHKEYVYCRKMMELGAKGYIIKTTPFTEIIVALKEVAAGGEYIDLNLGNEI